MANSRNPGSFDQGLDNFRTSVNPYVLPVTQHSHFRTMESGEAFVRFGELISDESYLGLMYGRLFAPDISMRQFRSDAVYFQSRWSFFAQYFGLTYHYRIQPAGTARYAYEIGGVLGFMGEPKWRTDGYYLSPYQLSRLQTSHTGTQGTMSRIEGAVIRNLGEHVFLRAGVSQTYMYMTRFTGIVNSSGGYWANLRNGGYFALSPTQFASTFVVTPDPILGPTQASLIRDRAEITWSFTQFFVSAGFRF